MAAKWIKGAIKHPGAFKKKAEGAGDSTEQFAKASLKPGSNASSHTKKQAALAETLMGLKKPKIKRLTPKKNP